MMWYFDAVISICKHISMLHLHIPDSFCIHVSGKEQVEFVGMIRQRKACRIFIGRFILHIGMHTGKYKSSAFDLIACIHHQDLHIVFFGESTQVIPSDIPYDVFGYNDVSYPYLCIGAECKYLAQPTHMVIICMCDKPVINLCHPL